MKIKLLYLAVLCVSMGCNAADTVAPAKPKCTSEPCGNTATGEDPQEVRYKEAVKEREQLNKAGSDADRWADTLYSDSKPDRLEREVIRAAGLKMRLDPKKGHLTFEAPGTADTFEISTPAGFASSTCPKYNLTVIDASAAHVLVKKNCPIFEIGENRISMSSEYYLYDAKTSSMRNVWAAVASTKGQKFPTAKPAPVLKRLPDGYRFDWTGLWPNDPDKKTIKISNSYIWAKDKGTAKAALLCTDLNAPKGEGIENEMCQGGVLPLLSSVKK